MALDNENLNTQGDENAMRSAYAAALGVKESADVETAVDPASAIVDTSDASASADTVTETAEQKADRVRDEKGRYAQLDKTQEKTAPKVDAQAAEVPAVVAPKVARPSSWKKDHWQDFDKLATENPKLAQYLNQRESEFATGVSTYKAEVDRLRPLENAVSEFVPMLQGRDVGEWINTLGNVHKTFAYGAPQEKLNALLKLAHEYNVPLSAHLAQGGQVPQFNPQAVQPVPQPQQDVSALVQAEFQKHSITQQVKEFAAAKDVQGNPLYPYFEALRPKMIGLLQAGLTEDLKSAYDSAKKLDADILQQEQEAKANADAAAKAAQSQAVVARAKRNAVSITDSTRSANMSSGGDKGLREGYEASLGLASGRI